jgi:hypothetical protein
MVPSSTKSRVSLLVEAVVLAPYLVKWLGYPHWEATWEKASTLSGARDAIVEYERLMADHDSF